MDKFYMAGTEGTGKYVVTLVTDRGRVGFREFSPGRFRVRVEPETVDSAASMSADFDQTEGWKQPGSGGQNRFSLVVSGQTELEQTVEHAVKALMRDCTTVQTNGPEWARKLASANVPAEVKSQLLARAKELKVPGANSRWSLVTLQSKVAAATPAETEDEERARLVAAVKASKVPGCNGAARWSLATLRAKVG